MSSIQLDDSHTPTKRGGQEVGYQGRKKSKTTNALFLTDKNGLSIAMSQPMAGNHHDLFDIENVFPKMLEDMHAIGINPDGLLRLKQKLGLVYIIWPSSLFFLKRIFKQLHFYLSKYKISMPFLLWINEAY